LAITQLTDDIDITGTITGNNANNFTVTGTNSPSAFTFTESADNSITGNANNAGWKAFTSGSSVSTIPVGQGIRVLIRGSKGQVGSLTGGSYTPDPVTISMTGPLMQGSLLQGLSRTSSAKGWNLVSNPYACNVDWTQVSKVNVADAIYTYRPSFSGGSYASYVSGSSTNGGSKRIEMGSALFVRASGSSPSLQWFEASKTTSNPANSTFRTQENIHNRISLVLTNAMTQNSDEVVMRFGDEPATDLFDERYDAENLAGTAEDLYVLDTTNATYSIYHGSELGLNDVREIKLGMGNLVAGQYTLNGKVLNAFANGHTPYLKDGLANTLTPITDTAVYPFTIGSNTADLQNRFSIVFRADKALPATVSFTVSVWPNPVKEVLTVRYAGLDREQPTIIRLVDMHGKTIKTIDIGKQTAGVEQIAMKGISSGVYTVQLMNGGTVQASKVVKE
jgi:hypothetical protein